MGKPQIPPGQAFSIYDRLFCQQGCLRCQVWRWPCEQQVESTAVLTKADYSIRTCRETTRPNTLYKRPLFKVRFDVRLQRVFPWNCHTGHNLNGFDNYCYPAVKNAGFGRIHGLVRNFALSPTDAFQEAPLQLGRRKRFVKPSSN